MKAAIAGSVPVDAAGLRAGPRGRAAASIEVAGAQFSQLLRGFAGRESSPAADTADAGANTGSEVAADRAAGRMGPAEEPPQAAAAVVQSGRQPSSGPMPHTHATPASAGLNELVRSLVDVIVHHARGRNGRWRLSMWLKPQVMPRTLLTFRANADALNIRFDTADSGVLVQLESLRTELRCRLRETLTDAQRVHIGVDVGRLTAEQSHENP
jgi:hypothetical protein